jgi:hypothetical protein
MLGLFRVRKAFKQRPLQLRQYPERFVGSKEVADVEVVLQLAVDLEES